jgi:hypothetical protein
MLTREASFLLQKPACRIRFLTRAARSLRRLAAPPKPDAEGFDGHDAARDHQNPN